MSTRTEWACLEDARRSTRPQPARPLPADPEQPEVVESRWGSFLALAAAGSVWVVVIAFFIIMGAV